ncbi:hypothetical protein ACRALDRAFT_2017327, partial [Sodiomyces alcalophilus JCM 7366]|uniref:uncharacterized protein n=1 Tax=Sodiomyces alcalophilus JCM 7366 TaxID=591952 RepID=UPI0039B5E033
GTFLYNFALAVLRQESTSRDPIQQSPHPCPWRKRVALQNGNEPALLSRPLFPPLLLLFGFLITVGRKKFSTRTDLGPSKFVGWKTLEIGQVQGRERGGSRVTGTQKSLQEHEDDYAAWVVRYKARLGIWTQTLAHASVIQYLLSDIFLGNLSRLMTPCGADKSLNYAWEPENFPLGAYKVPTLLHLAAFGDADPPR